MIFEQQLIITRMLRPAPLVDALEVTVTYLNVGEGLENTAGARRSEQRGLEEKLMRELSNGIDATRVASRRVRILSRGATAATMTLAIRRRMHRVEVDRLFRARRLFPVARRPSTIGIER